MKKRQLNKLKKIAAQMKSETTVQEAWDIVAEELVNHGSLRGGYTAFVSKVHEWPHLTVNFDDQVTILKSTLDVDQIKAKLYQEGRM